MRVLVMGGIVTVVVLIKTEKQMNVRREEEKERVDQTRPCVGVYVYV